MFVNATSPVVLCMYKFVSKYFLFIIIFLRLTNKVAYFSMLAAGL